MALLTIIRLSDESTGMCPCGCGEPAFPYTVEDEDYKSRGGYVDAAPKCAKTFLVDAGLLPDEDEEIPGFNDGIPEDAGGTL